MADMQPGERPAEKPMKDPSDTSGRLIAAEKVTGTKVYNVAGEKLGTVEDIMIDKISGQTQYAVLSFGGFMGFRDKHYPLPWRVLDYDTQQGGFVVDIDKEKLKDAPSYPPTETAAWDDPAMPRRVDEHYGVEPEQPPEARPAPQTPPASERVPPEPPPAGRGIPPVPPP